MNHPLVSIAAAIILCTLVRPGTGRGAQNRLTEPEQAVLAAFLRSQSGATSVCSDITVSDAPRSKAPRLREQLQESDAALREAALDLIQKSAAEAVVSLPTNQAPGLKTLSSEEYASLFRKAAGTNGWGEFHRRFPGANGITTVSRIGIGRAGTVALLHASRVEDGWGHARFYVLRKEAGQWHMTDERVLPMEDIYGLRLRVPASTLAVNNRIEPMTSSARMLVLQSSVSGALLVTAHPQRWV